MKTFKFKGMVMGIKYLYLKVFWSIWNASDIFKYKNTNTQKLYLNTAKYE